MVGEYKTPTVPNFALPALLGLESARNSRMVIDLNTLTVHMCGPGDYDLSSSLPPGTESFKCSVAPSGHLVLPCSEFVATKPGGVPRNKELSLQVRESC